MIVGDFYLPDIDYNLWTTCRSENHFSYLFLENLRDTILEQPINLPTRWLHDTPGNVLNLCLVDITEIIKDIDIATRLGNCDHLCLEIELIFPMSKDNMTSEKGNFYSGDYKTANSKLLKIEWNVMDDMNVEQCWSYYSENVKKIINDTIRIHMDAKKEPNPPGWTIIALSLLIRNTKLGNVLLSLEIA